MKVKNGKFYSDGEQRHDKSKMFVQISNSFAYNEQRHERITLRLKK